MSALFAPFLVVALSAQQPAAQPERQPWDQWLQDLRAEARTRGISDATIERALTGLVQLPVVVQRDASQAEFTLTLDAYLKRRLDAFTIKQARRALTTHKAVLRRVQTRYGVPPEVLVSVWGLESTFGKFTGVRPTIMTLATLAYEPRRASYFREELFNALRILDRGDIGLPDMRGSWAGAMGQVQFMPSSYLQYAVDMNRDGHKDVWSTYPDIFGSIANYLVEHGWVRGMRWGREVKLPIVEGAVTAIEAPRTEGCSARRGLSQPLPVKAWRKAGITRVSGKHLPASTQAASLLRLDNRVFLVYRNYEAILGYNCAHRYALSVALLSDRIAAR